MYIEIWLNYNDCAEYTEIITNNQAKGGENRLIQLFCPFAAGVICFPVGGPTPITPNFTLQKPIEEEWRTATSCSQRVTLIIKATEIVTGDINKSVPENDVIVNEQETWLFIKKFMSGVSIL